MLRHTFSRFAFTLIALGPALIVRPASGQAISFFQQFSAPGFDAVAADSSGIYVFWNAGVRKYDSHGNELWTRECAPANVIRGAAADATGAYVLGVAEPVLRKYSADGNELWTRQLEFRPSGDLAADSTGVYVTGGDFVGTFSYLRKYSPDGAELWTSRFENPRSVPNPNPGNPFPLNVDPTPYGLAVDATGVYVMNRIAGVVVRKWDPRGDELWTRQLLYPFDFPRKLAADPTGFYLVAWDFRGTGTFLRKYDSGGNELWSRKIDSSDHLGSKIAADATGLYLAGIMPMGYSPYRPWSVLPGQCASGSGGDAFVRKYDPGGEEVWARQFGTSQSTGAVGVALDSSGVYVVGGVSADAFRDAWELTPAEILETLEPGSAFVAKFEKTSAAVTGSAPHIFPDCVVNAASQLGGGVAPGEMVTLFGSSMGPSELVRSRLTEDRRLPTTLADARILFNGAPAPLVYVSGKKSGAIVPYSVAGRISVDVQVEYKGVRSDAVTVPVLASRPGIFSVDRSGEGQAAILNEDGSHNSPSNPAQRGSVITLFGTGGGEAAPGVVDGQIVSDVLARTSLPVSVFFDLGDNENPVKAKQGDVLYAGGVSGSVAGLLQVQVRVPPNVVTTGGAVPFALFIGSHWTVYQVTVALR